MTATGETVRQRAKKLKKIEKGSSSDISKIIGADVPLEAASRIARKSKGDFINSKRKKTQTTQKSKSVALLDTKTIIKTLFREALNRYSDYIPEELIDKWVSRYTKIKMTYTMNMRFLAAALVWYYRSFDNNDVEPETEVDKEFTKQVEKEKSELINEIILRAKPILSSSTVLLSGGDTFGEGLEVDEQQQKTGTSSIVGRRPKIVVTVKDKFVLLTYAVWLVYDASGAYVADETFLEEEEEEEYIQEEEENNEEGGGSGEEEEEGREF